MVVYNFLLIEKRCIKTASKLLISYLFLILSNVSYSQIHPHQIGFSSNPNQLWLLGIDTLNSSSTFGLGRWYNFSLLLDSLASKALGDHDWYELGDTAPNAIDDEIYHSGKVHIGDALMTGSSKLSVNGRMSLEDGDGNLFISGGNSGYTSAKWNTGIGIRTLEGLTTGEENTSVGRLSLYSITEGNYNVGVGASALQQLTTGYGNTAVGRSALLYNVQGVGNTAIGTNALVHSLSGENTALGYQAGAEFNTGTRNTILGFYSGASNTTGSNNTFIGSNSGQSSTGSGNVFVGYASGKNETGSNKLYISNSSSDELIRGDFSTDSVHIKGSLRLRDEFIDGNGAGGIQGQILSSTESSTLWIDGSSIADDWGEQIVEADNTLLGEGTIAEELKVDTSLIATKHYVDSLVNANVAYYFLTSDFTTTSSTAVTITGLSFTPVADKKYLISGKLLLRTSNASVGAKAGMNWPTAGVTDNGGSLRAATGPGGVSNSFFIGTTNGQTNAAGTFSNTTQSHMAEIQDAFLIMGASPSGNYSATLKSNGTVTVTCKAGSYLRVETLPF